MPRKSVEPLVTKVVRLPQSMADRVDLLLLDPVRGKVQYGAFNSLMIRLLNEWLTNDRGTKP